jgi:hypothetical protein
MNEDKVKAMFALADKLDRLDNVLRLKCEICGPILRGSDPKRYPLCKKHGVKE